MGRFERIEELIDRLGENEEKYKIFLDASPFGILVVDQTFHIAFVNKTFERMSGYRMDELVSRHMHILLPKDDIDVHIDREKEYLKRPHDRTGNHGLRPRLLTKDGSIVYVEISLSPTRIGGQQFFFASIRPLESLFNTVKGIVRDSTEYNT